MNALVPLNRYLVDPRGRDLGPRGRVTIESFALLVLSMVLGIAAALVSDVTGLAIMLAVASFAVFVAQPIVLWRRLLRAARDLEAATMAWHRGDISLAMSAGHFALAKVFRGDIRLRAFHLLGLVAEQQGDFVEAADLFARAEAALPSMAAPRRKRDARVLMSAHRAICLTAIGNLVEAHALLQRASQDLSMAGQSGTLDALTDDATWGLGSASVNEMLVKLEGGRPARAILSLAWALFHLARSDHHAVIQLVEGERAVLDHGLLPRERALVGRMFALSVGASGPGPHRSPGVLVTTESPWTDAVLARIAPSR